MIHSFGDELTEDIFNGHRSKRTRRIAATLIKTTVRKLDMLNAAHKLGDLRVPPGNRLEALKGNLDGYHSIRVNNQWRLIFVWADSGILEVQLIDYH